jgi:hypothetical protein
LFSNVWIITIDTKYFPVINRCQDPDSLRIAGVRFAVSSEQAVRLRIVNPLYRSFASRPVPGMEIPEISVNLVLGSVPPLRGMEQIFDTDESWSMFRESDRLWIKLHPPRQATPFWAARFNRSVSQVDFYCEAPASAKGKKAIDISHPVHYPLDQLLLMYFLARRRGMLTHAAGVVHGGEAFIFPGSSGAGKSTFSELLAGAKVGRLLSDERMVVREIDGAMQAFGTPWAGTAGIARNGHAPLAGIFFLKHGPGNHIEKLAAGDAADKLLPLISIPWYDPDTMALIVAFAKRLAAMVPAYEMSFKPDRSAVDFFWQFQKASS